MANRNAEYEEALNSLTRAIIAICAEGNPASIWHQIHKLEQEYPEGNKARTALRVARDRIATDFPGCVLPHSRTDVAFLSSHQPQEVRLKVS